MEDRYTDSILQRGVVYGVRGLPFAQWSKGRSYPLLALTWGGLSSSFYKAKDYVQREQAHTLYGCVLTDRMPREQ